MKLHSTTPYPPETSSESKLEPRDGLILCAPAPDKRHVRRSYQRVYVGETPHGKGVFARHLLLAEQRVGRVTGTVIREPGYTSEYCIELTKHRQLEPSQPFCYLNHSCEPNCELVWLKLRNRQGKRAIRVVVETLRHIQPEEQLTIDYCWPLAAAIPCECGSKSCRGWIADEEELDDWLQKQ